MFLYKTWVQGQSKKEQYYNDGITLLKQGKYSNALEKLVIFENESDDSKFVDGKYLYYFAEEKTSPSLTLQEHFLPKIPDNYNGPLAEDIIQEKSRIATEEKQNNVIAIANKNKMRQKQEDAEDTERTKQMQYRNSHLYVGDPESKIEDVFGTPERINRNVTGNSVHKQYVYGDGHYIYVENGVVTGFQD